MQAPDFYDPDRRHMAYCLAWNWRCARWSYETIGAAFDINAMTAARWVAEYATAERGPSGEDTVESRLLKRGGRHGADLVWLQYHADVVRSLAELPIVKVADVSTS